jgi:hypothetical protein
LELAPGSLLYTLVSSDDKQAKKVDQQTKVQTYFLKSRTGMSFDAILFLLIDTLSGYLGHPVCVQKDCCGQPHINPIVCVDLEAILALCLSIVHHQIHPQS